MNNQNIHQINSDIEKAINISKLRKDKYDQSKKKTRDYSGLQAYVVNELYVDNGVVRTRTLNKKQRNRQPLIKHCTN